MYCRNYGSEIPEGAKFCGKCGTKIENENTKEIPTNQSQNYNNSHAYSKKTTKISFGSWLVIILVITFIIVLALVGMVYMIDTSNKKSFVDNSNSATEPLETEEQKQEKLKQQEKKAKIDNAIKSFAEYVRQSNDGKMKYDKYTTYKTTSDGTTIYKLKYTTSINYSHIERYYYQFVSLDSNNVEVLKSTKLYPFELQKIGDKQEEYGDTYAMEYEIETLWK